MEAEAGTEPMSGGLGAESREEANWDETDHLR